MDPINSKYKTIKEWAYAYRKMGWNVIPLFAYSKIPQDVDIWTKDFGWVPGWKELQKRNSTDEEFERWFVYKVPTGLGVVTGKISGIFVVDEDSYKADGMQFKLSSPFTAKTARGGTHHFFKYSDGTKTSGFRKGVNIEIKSDGGFIVLPPSEVYIDDKQTKGKYLWNKVCPLIKLPTLTEADLKPYRLGGESFVTEDLRQYLHVGSGERHNSLRTFALILFNRAKSNELGAMAEIVRQTAAGYTPPYGPRDTERLIEDCMKHVKNHPKESQAEVEANTMRPKTLTEVYTERKEERKLELIAPRTGYPELDRLIKGFIPGHLYTLTGNTNVGKTSLACNFTERVRKQGKKILYFALEPENTVIDYLASVRTDKQFGALTDDDIKFDDGNIHVYGKQEVSDLYTLVRIVQTSKTDYALIVVDHIGYFIKSSENFIQEQSKAIKKLVGLAKARQTAVLIIAHLRKQPTKSKKEYIPTADDISGSGAFKQDSTEVLIVIRPADESDPNNIILSDYGKLFVAKTKSGMNGAVTLIFGKQTANILSHEEVNSIVNRKPIDELTLAGFPDRPKKDVALLK